MASMKSKELRFSHTEGHTEACFDKTGKYILTAGADGDVRVYNGLLDDDAVSFRVGTQVTAVAVREKEIAVATDGNEVKAFSVPEGIQQDILVRFTARVNTLCFNRNGRNLAAGSSDFNIKVITNEENSDMVHKEFCGHDAPVLSVAISPDDHYLASSSCDGTLKIWDMSNQVCLKSLDIFPKCNDTSTSKTLCKIAWCYGKTQVIAAPVERGIMFILPGSWKELCTLVNVNSELTSILSCSPCGNYLASSTIAGEIKVWDVEEKRQMESMKHENGSKITALNWNPIEPGELVYADDQGQFSVCSDVLTKVFKKNPYNASDFFADSDNEGLANDNPRKRLHEDDDDDDDIPVGSSHKKHRVQNFENFLDDEADDFDDDDADISLDLIKEGLVPKPSDAVEENEDLDSMQDFIVDDEPKKPSFPSISLQKAFQPGSTPAHLMHRFMTWNTIGIIRCHSEEEVSTIDIEFHDAGLHHPLHFTNTMNHTIAGLSSTAAVLACQSQDDLPSKLVCLHFGTWDSNKEWTASMPNGEDIKSVAVNQSYVAVATDKRMVRIFTVGGMQFNLFSIPGPVVTMVMSETQLIIVYHQGTGLPECQCLGVKLFEISSKNWRTSTEHQLPLSKKATLIWVGFSAEETPVFVDSCGVVRLLQRSFGNTWIPILNLKNQTKTKSDNYWVIGVTENPPEIRCILCKASNFPATLPRPIPSALSFQIPICDNDTEKGQMEENYIQNRITMGFYDYQKKKSIELDTVSSAEAKKAEIQLLIKLFALSCKSDRIFRAVEICELMSNAETVNLAIQYATRMRKMNLAQRLGDIARRKALEDDNVDEISDSEDESSNDYRPPVVSMPSRSSSSYSRPIKGLNMKGRNMIKIKAKRKDPSDISDSEEDNYEDLKKTETINAQSNNHEDDDERMNDDDAEEYLIAKDRTLPSNNIQNSQGRVNPFKSTKKTQSESSGNHRGTTYFETLESTMPPKHKTGITNANLQLQVKTKGKSTQKSTSKQATLFQKSSPTLVGKKATVEENKIQKNQSKKVTGFMLFREQLSNEKEEQETEEFMKISLEKWKKLSTLEKKNWNIKAKEEKQVNDSFIQTNDNEHNLESKHNENQGTFHVKMDEQKEKNSNNLTDTKTKLSMFAFSKK